MGAGSVQQGTLDLATGEVSSVDNAAVAVATLAGEVEGAVMVAGEIGT
jgi:hypothetical protein